eukprot:GFYU01015445.1.p1 GENE.GFYU01015445.1~~GFYU01015445.1.p1  ORF type:complete len:420 (+),score=97.69 GFYU01015445.1:103-1362(+)
MGENKSWVMRLRNVDYVCIIAINMCICLVLMVLKTQNQAIGDETVVQVPLEEELYNHRTQTVRRRLKRELEGDTFANTSTTSYATSSAAPSPVSAQECNEKKLLDDYAMSVDGRPRSNLAIVMPFVVKQTEKLIRIMKMWDQEGTFPCSLPLKEKVQSYDGRSKIDLIIYYNNLWNSNSGKAAKEEIMNTAQTLYSIRCFDELRFLEADLNEEEGADYRTTGYYGVNGPQRQFYKLFWMPELGRYDYFMLLEPDVWPIRAGWLDEVHRITEDEIPTSFTGSCKLENDQSPNTNVGINYWNAQQNFANTFWIKGSIHRGTEGLHWSFADHINGNALYKLHDPEFDAFMKENMRRWPVEDPNVQPQAFDVAIFYTIMSKEYRHKVRYYVYSEFLQNYHTTPVTKSSLSHRTVLVHADKPPA